MKKAEVFKQYSLSVGNSLTDLNLMIEADFYFQRDAYLLFAVKVGDTRAVVGSSDDLGDSLGSVPLLNPNLPIYELGNTLSSFEIELLRIVNLNFLDC